MAGKSVFILGSGQIGRAAALSLADLGWRVRLAHRAGGAFPGALREGEIDEVFVDREEDGALVAALAEGADAVIDTIAYTPEHARQLHAVQDRVGAFVVISSCSVYRDRDGRTLDEAAENGFPRFDGPISETQPTIDAGPATYSTRKVAMEQALAAIDRPVGILRPGAIHGPGCNAPREWWFVKRALDGRRIVPVAYDGASRFHTTAAANIGELCRVVLEQRASGVFNIGDPHPPSVREIGEAIADVLDHPWEIVGLPKHPHGAVGLTPWSVPRPLLIDTTKAERLGYSPIVTYASSLGVTCDDLLDRAQRLGWLQAFPGLASYPEPWFDYTAENVFLAA